MKNRKKNPECTDSPTGKHEWKTQTAEDEDRDSMHDWGLIIGTFCKHCLRMKKDVEKK